jgi:hypothetical protein
MLAGMMVGMGVWMMSGRSALTQLPLNPHGMKYSPPMKAMKSKGIPKTRASTQKLKSRFISCLYGFKVRMKFTISHRSRTKGSHSVRAYCWKTIGDGREYCSIALF